MLRFVKLGIVLAVVLVAGIATSHRAARAHSGADQIGVNQTSGCFYNPLVEIYVSGYNQNGNYVTGHWSKAPTQVCTLTTNGWWWQTWRGVTISAHFMGTPGVTADVWRTCKTYKDDGWWQFSNYWVWVNMSPSSNTCS